MGEVREAVVSIMERVTLAELCERARCLETASIATLDYVI